MPPARENFSCAGGLLRKNKPVRRSEDYEGAIRLVNEGRVQLAPLVSKHFAFKEYLEAYRYIDANRESTMKVIIDVDR